MEFLPALAIVVDKFAQRDFEVPLLGDDMVEIRRFCADRESPGKPSAAENGAGRAYGFPSSAVAAAALSCAAFPSFCPEKGVSPETQSPCEGSRLQGIHFFRIGSTGPDTVIICCLQMECP